MTNPIEQWRYENTQRLLDSNSTKFLTPDEQMFIGQQLNRAILRKLEDNSNLNAESLSSLSNLCDWLKNDGRSTSPEDVSAAYDALLGLQKLPDLSDEQRRYSKNLLLRFLNYAGALPNRPLDLQPADTEYLARLNAFGKKSALSDTKFQLQPNPGFPARLPENFRAATGDLSDRNDTGLNAMTDIFKFSRNELLTAMYLDFLSGKSDWDMNALLEKSRRLSRCKYYSEPDDAEAIYTLYGNPFAKFIDRYGALGKRAFDALEANTRISAFDNFVLPEIDEQISKARETARINAERNPGRELDGSFSEPLSESTRQNVLDNFIDLFDSNGLDSSWLRELKGADFSIFFNEKKGDNARTGGITVQDAENGLAVLMNAKDGKSYREMRIALLHELRHVWQRLNEPWKSKFGDGISTKTDMDIEVDAHEKQFALERIFGMEAGNTRNVFENISNNPNEKEKEWAKAAYLYFYPYKKEKNRYRLNSTTDYKTPETK